MADAVAPNQSAEKSSIICVLDRLMPNEIAGWAVDLAAPSQPLHLHVVVDGEDIARIACDRPRSDLSKTRFPTEAGFSLILPPRFLDGRTHRLEFRTRRFRHIPLPFIHQGREHSWLDFAERPRDTMLGHVDDCVGDCIIGWVLRGDADGQLRGGASVRVMAGGELVGYAKADHFRPDIAAAHDADAYCGFRFRVPLRYRRARPIAFDVAVLPGGIELPGSPLLASVVSDVQEIKLATLQGVIDRADAAVTEARHLLQTLLPRPQYEIGNYADWARTYFPRLRARVLEQPTPEGAPLISLVCPVYKPALHHFTAAVESVLAQTYPNWELILVDDRGRSPAVSAQITAFAARDSRIRALRMPRRGGISAASNQALGAARGEWIGFFDHDDLLVDVALAVMLDHAAASGASLLYSDEDKIEPNGRLTEPHFKPDWNYRLLLGNNYLCHFLMVRRATLDAVGPLRSAYDGAQDHDLLLRLAEHLPASAIHHVPEVLYHWRRTDSSTAATPTAKPYVARAGVAAIEAHLSRRGLTGRADAYPQTTLYRVTWRFSSQPSVAIIIPFRDAAAMTRRCVESLLQLTAYAKFEILLVDNWSTEPDALAMLDALRTQPRVRVLRVEEEFNFSRLNNRAAASTDADFLVLHNNDVLHNDPEWLTSLVSEALADPAVAVVGAKLLYPYRAIQHAGILLGMWGVAGHMHSGLPAEAPGYAGRALLTQEVSAVTAACMLVRHSVYDALSGLDEQALPVTFNDVDFCLRVRAAGHKVIQANHYVAEHHESFTRGADDEPAKEARFRAECRIMKERWARFSGATRSITLVSIWKASRFEIFCRPECSGSSEKLPLDTATDRPVLNRPAAAEPRHAVTLALRASSAMVG